MKKKSLLFFLLWSLCLTSCARWFPKGVEHFNFGSYSEAEAAFNKGNYQEAIDKYTAYITENPEGNLAVIAKYYTAKSYSNLAKPDQARVLYQEIMDKHPDLVWAKFSESQLKDLAEAPALPPVPAPKGKMK